MMFEQWQPNVLNMPFQRYLLLLQKKRINITELKNANKLFTIVNVKQDKVQAVTVDSHLVQHQLPLDHGLHLQQKNSFFKNSEQEHVMQYHLATKYKFALYLVSYELTN
jgi:hypothetical protein